MKDVFVKNLAKRFGEAAAVKGITFQARASQMTTLLGPSGCGKTTTLRCIAGLEDPTGGEIYLGDKLLASGDKGVVVRPEERNIGMVFQQYAIWPHLTVFENIAFGLRVRRRPESEIAERVHAVTETVRLSGRERHYPSQLSGGQQQRVVLARALAYDPELLLLDEPLANLDAKLREQMRFELREIQAKTGVTAIYVTHDQSEAMVISDQIIVMNEGIIEQVGGPEEIYERPCNEFVAAFIGLTNMVPVEQVGKEADMMVAQTPLGGVALVDNGCGRPGPLKLSIRPEDIVLWPERPSGRVNVWESRVEQRVFLGETNTYQVDVNGVALRVHAPRRVKFPVGSRVFVEIEPARVVVVAR